MSKETTRTHEQDNAPEQRVRNDWKALLEKLSYTAIVSNVPYLSFIVVLGVVYISFNKKAVEVQRELNRANDTLKELHWEYMDAQSQMMYAQMETEVIRNAAKIGLKPMLRPAFRVEKDTATQKAQAN